MARREVTRRLAIVVIAAAAVVLASVAGPLLAKLDRPPEDSLDTSEWNQSRNVESYDTRGSIAPNLEDGNGQTIVLDTTHANQFDRQDVLPLVRALIRANYTVRFNEQDNLTRALSDAIALLVIQPSTPYEGEDLAAIRNFTEDGGHLLVVTEPTHKTVQIGLGGASIASNPSNVKELLAAYDIVVDGRYVYNQRRNDGSYKDVVGRAAQNASLPDGEYVFFTAAPLYAPAADPLVVASPGTRLSDTDDRGRYALAVETENTIVFGDVTFLTTGHHNVADNERLLRYLVRFLVRGDTPETDDQTAEDTDRP